MRGLRGRATHQTAHQADSALWRAHAEQTGGLHDGARGNHGSGQAPLWGRFDHSFHFHSLTFGPVSKASLGGEVWLVTTRGLRVGRIPHSRGIRPDVYFDEYPRIVLGITAVLSCWLQKGIR